MSGTISLFMKKELTCLPSVFNKYVSKYYNNALGNAFSWAFFIWLIMHVTFEKFINAMLRQMKYPEYYRERVASTLWNFGFTFCSFVYCFVLLSNNNFHVSDIQSNNQFLIDHSSDLIPSQYILGFIILSSYYAQNAFREATKNGFDKNAVNNLLFLLLGFFAYMKGWCELFFSIVTISSLTQSTLEMSKIFSFQIYNRRVMSAISELWYLFHFILCFMMYFIILPLQFLIPCGRNFRNEINLAILILNVLLWAWFLVNIFDSVLFKMVKHYVYHMNEEDVECKLSMLECCMFPRRTDTVYGVVLVKQAIERRREFMHLQRKKPNKVALYQTLKCMVTMKRKLKHRRAANEASCSTDDISPTTSEVMDFDLNPISDNELNTEKENTKIASSIVDQLLET